MLRGAFAQVSGLREGDSSPPPDTKIENRHMRLTCTDARMMRGGSNRGGTGESAGQNLLRQQATVPPLHSGGTVVSGVPSP